MQADSAAWELGCPVCKALPDEACVTPRGKPRNDHKQRPKEHDTAYQRGGRASYLPRGRG